MSVKHDLFPRLFSLPVTPARTTDPATSHQAAAANTEVRGRQRVQVMQYLKAQGAKGATDFEISQGTGLLRSSASKRRGELTAAGLVSKTAQRRKTDTNSTAIVWTVAS